jgi:hypothetical protein
VRRHPGDTLPLARIAKASSKPSSKIAIQPASPRRPPIQRMLSCVKNVWRWRGKIVPASAFRTIRPSPLGSTTASDSIGGGNARLGTVSSISSTR